MRLKSKKYLSYKGKVYDLQVESGDHSYIVNNIVVHNSAGGSLVSYLLDVTKIDPIKYKLLFERFLNEGRIKVTLPDVDEDFESDRREEVKRYMERKYGIDHVASVGTYNTYKVKSAFQDLCRVYGIPSSKADYLSKIIDDGFNGRWTTSDGKFYFKTACSNPEFYNFMQENPDLINSTFLILKQASSISIHPCATIITPKKDEHGNDMTIYDWMPLRRDKTSGVLITEWTGDVLAEIGFLKEDILGILQLDKFKSIFNYIEKHTGKKLTYDDIVLDDPDVMNLFKKGISQDIFQFGTHSLIEYTKRVQPDTVEELIAINAIFRPGPIDSGAHDDFVDIKFGKKDAEFDKHLEEVTKDTFGLYIYQEQVMAAASILGDFDMTEADDVRRAMGKMKASAMEPYRIRFLDGAVKKGYTPADAQALWDKLLRFSSYGYNRCISQRTKMLRVGINKNGTSTFDPTIEEMYNIMYNLEYAKKSKHEELYYAYKKKKPTLWSLNEDRKLIYNQIKEIRFAGVKKTYLVTTESGKTCSVTMNHKFPTSNGEKKLENINIEEDFLYVDSGYEVSKYTQILGDGIFNSKKGKVGFQKKEHSGWKTFNIVCDRLLDKHKNCECCKVDLSTVKRTEIHHIDKNPNNNIDSNLEVLCPKCHKFKHKGDKVKGGKKGHPTHFEKIVSIEFDRIENVYDVEMEAPYHTFTFESGIVTSNSHAAAYAITAYFCMWFKNHFPLEFYTVSLTFSEEKKVPAKISEINQLGTIKISSPDINSSTDQFIPSPKKQQIYWALNKIKFVGDVAVECIVQEREKNGKYFSLDEFLSRVDTSKVNSRVMTNLILAGAFDEVENIKTVTERYRVLVQYHTLVKKKLNEEDYSRELISKEYFWKLKQKEITGIGELDYTKIHRTTTFKNLELVKETQIYSKKYDGKKTVVVAGILTTVTERSPKNNPSNKFAQLTLNVNDVEVFVTMWSECWNEFKEKLNLYKGGIILMSGNCKHDDFKGKNVIYSNYSSEVIFI